MRALLAGAMVELRNGLVLEIYQGEPLVLFGGTIEGSDTWSTLSVGRHDIVVIGSTGERIDLTLACFDPAMLPFIERQLRQIGHGAKSPAQPVPVESFAPCASVRTLTAR